MDYKSAGVDVEAGYKAVELMKKHIGKTLRPEVVGGLGGFGGAFSIAAAKNMDEPILVSGTDGVGTKLKVAFLADKHDTIGIDAVAMCVNDIICMGAEPLFVLDYIACDKNYPQKIEAIVSGIAEGCAQANASLIGGETAEMPGVYQENEYDIAAFTVGIVDKKNIIDGKDIVAGDILVGLKSNGLHSNGFSLVRKILNLNEDNIDIYADELLKPTRIYVKPILEVIKKVKVKGISNITGGGFYENIPRIVPQGLGINIFRDNWEVPEIFKLLQEKGNVTEENMLKTFNMGIGMVLAVAEADAKTLVDELIKLGETPYIIGSIRPSGGLEIC